MSNDPVLDEMLAELDLPPEAAEMVAKTFAYRARKFDEACREFGRVLMDEIKKTRLYSFFSRR